MRDAALGVKLLTAAVLGISSGILMGTLLARAQNPEAGHAIADKFAREAGKADKDAQKRAADAKRKADAEKKKREDARRKAEEAEMLGIARAEAEARRQEQEKARVELEAEEARLIAEARAAEAVKAAEATKQAERRAEDERRIAEAKAAEEARITAALEAQRAKEENERRQAEAKAAEEARQAAARAAEEDARRIAEARVRAEEERRIAETLAAARARDEAQREAAQRTAAAEARRAADMQAAEEFKKRLEAERQQAMAAEREAEAQRVSERLREARQSRQESRQEQARHELPRSVEAPIGAPVVADGQPVRHGGPVDDAPGRIASPLPERVTVLMLLEPGDRGIRRHNKTADPLLCNGQGCYVSNGPAAEAAFLPGRRALGFGRTFGARAGACSNRLGCVFRNVEYAAIAGLVQPIDMRVMRHDRREPTTLDGVSDCVATKLRLACRRTIESGSYVLWIVPEALAEAIGPDLLEQALADGLPRSEQAALPPSWR